MDWSAIVGIITFVVGGVISLWFRINSQFEKVSRDCDEKIHSLEKKLSKEHEKNAEQQKQIELLEQRVENNESGIGDKLDTLNSRVSKLTERLDKHMVEEPKLMKEMLNDAINVRFRQVMSEELRRVAKK